MIDPIGFLEEAVETPSHESVDAMTDLLVATLEEAGVEPTIHESGTVLATRGAGDGPTVLLNTHIDTVAPHVPLERSEDRIAGRGACDAKGPLAAMLAAFLAADPVAGRLTLAVTPDEETDSTGAHAILADDVLGDVDAVVVGEPTGLAACTAAKGRYELEVTVVGESAHAATPADGANAIAGLHRVLEVIESVDEGAASHPSLGPPSLTPTVIEGGMAANQVPESVRLTLDRRPVPPETFEGFLERLRSSLDDASEAGVTVTVERSDRPTPFLEAWATDHDETVVEAILAAGAADPRPFAAATEASYFSALAPTVVFGPGSLTDDEGPVAHARREYVPIEEVREATQILETTLERLLQ